MDKNIESLMKERLPVHPKCRGEGFSDEQTKFILSKRCSRIEPVDNWYVDPNDDFTKVVHSFTDPDCRCTAYVNPSNWWKHESWRCPLGDHFRPDLAIKDAKGRVGQQKQKKKKK
jgi:hypothetical protein